MTSAGQAAARGDWSSFRACPACRAAEGETCYSLRRKSPVDHSPPQPKKRPCAGRPTVEGSR